MSNFTVNDIPMNVSNTVDARDMVTVVNELRELAKRKHTEANDYQQKASISEAIADSYNDSANRLERRLLMLLDSKLNKV